jgi:hypothetical protein
VMACFFRPAGHQLMWSKGLGTWCLLMSILYDHTLSNLKTQSYTAPLNTF